MSKNNDIHDADMKALMAEAYASEPELTLMDDRGDFYMCGTIMQVVPGLWENAHNDVLRAFLARRIASLRGECPACGAFNDVTNRGKCRQHFLHEDGCIATDDFIAQLYREHPMTPQTAGARLLDPHPKDTTLDGRHLLVLDDEFQITGEAIFLYVQEEAS